MLDIGPVNQLSSITNNVENESENISTEKKIGFDQTDSTKPGVFGIKPQETTRNIFIENESDNSKLIGLFTFIVLAIVLITSGFIYYLKSNKQSQLDTKERIHIQYQRELTAPELKQVDKLATRYNLGLKELTQLILGSYKYTKLFNRLEEVTPNEVTISSFSVDTKNSVKIDAKTNSIENLAIFARALENASEFSNVVVNGKTLVVSVTDSTETYSFTITCNLNLVIDKDNSKGETNAT